ncbi:hypothetical protein AVEN_122183-1 [Araneus ventricosus]|uniref:Uncharacterized protein n=1 Tax=Araneus ventricosus TaxID=182803 RepID=A0A4Y2IGL7_ARAVE|nr:hypothetical protein AVEN_122183-1 [Araneus ventricosus]
MTRTTAELASPPPNFRNTPSDAVCPLTSDLRCTRPTYTADLQWTRVSNLEPSGPEAGERVIDASVASLRRRHEDKTPATSIFSGFLGDHSGLVTPSSRDRRISGCGNKSCQSIIRNKLDYERLYETLKFGQVFIFLEECLVNRIIALENPLSSGKSLDWPPCSRMLILPN